MAGRAVLGNLDHQRIVVTIGCDGHNVLIIAAGLTLQPKLLPGTAPKTCQLLLHGDLETLFVHIGKGQHLPGFRVHYNRRDQTLFIKFQFRNIDHRYNLTLI